MRRRRAEKRPLIPDVVYNSEIIARLINTVMKRGKKATAQGIVYQALETVKEKHPGEDVLEVFLQALENIKPRLEVKSRRVGGATYQVPLEVAPERQVAIAVRWLVLYARNRNAQNMGTGLSAEILDAYANTGGAVRKREEVHKMANANKAFAHFRW
jgi:small subunit ribosomal protein S7